MAEIREVVSENLQATIRRLLPSQRGFTEDLQASNVITPIIDITPSAEGSQLPVDLARAVSLDGATVYNVNGTTSTLISTPGFYRMIGCAANRVSATAVQAVNIIISDGTTTKRIWSLQTPLGLADEVVAQSYDLNVFLKTGDSLQIAASTDCTIRGSLSQIADVYGNIENPAGFAFQ